MSALNQQLNSHKILYCGKTSNTIQNGCVFNNSVLGILLWWRKEWKWAVVCDEVQKQEKASHCSLAVLVVLQ